MKKIVLICIVILALLSACKNRSNIVTISTGSISGLYYPTGGAIGSLVNKKMDAGFKIAVLSTAGSVYNINTVVNGESGFGIAQSDRQYQAVNGEAEWKESGKQSKIRSVFALYPETITLIASQESSIKSIKDLAGKKVNLGDAGSGQLQNSIDILNAFSLNEDAVQAVYEQPAEVLKLFEKGELAAFFYTVGHPNNFIRKATSGRTKAIILPVTGKEVETLLEGLPYYGKSLIPNKFYPRALNTDMVESIGVKATLITSIDVSEEVVYTVTKAVFENFGQFINMHPAYRILTKKGMLHGLSAPIHPGALKYYKEVGLDTEISAELIQE